MVLLARNRSGWKWNQHPSNSTGRRIVSKKGLEITLLTCTVALFSEGTSDQWG